MHTGGKRETGRLAVLPKKGALASYSHSSGKETNSFMMHGIWAFEKIKIKVRRFC